MSRWLRGSGALGAVLLVLAACSQPPTLLHQDDFEGVTWASHEGVAVPGWGWCMDLNPGRYAFGRGVIGSILVVPDGTIGAAILKPALGTEGLVRSLTFAADQCAQLLVERPDSELSIEALTGLPDGAIGWRTQRPISRGSDDYVEQGELVVLPLDEGRMLAVGFTSTTQDPPVDLDDLIALAEKGAEQFPATD